MPTRDPNNYSLAHLFLIGLSVMLAMFGGVAKYLADVQEKKSPFTWAGIFIQSVISAFTGSIATLYMMDQGFSEFLVLIGSGLFGFGGVAVLQLVMRKLYRHIGVENKQGSENER